VLSAFASRLIETGRRVSGLIQLREPGDDKDVRNVVVLDGWQVVDAARKPGAPESGCRLDSGWLDRMGLRVEASIRSGVDAVIVNRFGPLEAAGRGFHNAILAASQTQTPLVVAVPAFAFEGWTRFSGGMSVRLDCSLDSVLAWWRRVSAPGASTPAERACELLK